MKFLGKFVEGFAIFWLILLLVGLVLAGLQAPEHTPVPEQVRQERVHREEDRRWAAEEAQRQKDIARELGHPLGEP